MATPQAAFNRLRAAALAYPEAWEDKPWGETVVKVRKKIFVFLGRGDGLSCSLKLPDSCLAALMFPFADPTGYGLGASGWISASFGRGEKVPVELLLEWLDESYRAVAPRKLWKTLDAPAPAPAPPAVARRKPARTAVARPAAAKKPSKPKAR